MRQMRLTPVLLALIVSPCLLVFWLWLTSVQATDMYHVDDSYVYDLMTELVDKGRSPLAVSVDEVAKDFQIRFRPLFHPTWVARVWAFGDSWYLHSLSNAVFGWWASMAFCAGLALFGFPALGIAIFLGVTFLGEQVEAYILRFAQEPLGILILSMAFVACAARSCVHRHAARVACAVSFLLLVAMAACYKESFLAGTIPMAICWLAAVQRVDRTSFLAAARSQLAVLLVLAVIVAGGAMGVAASGANKAGRYYAVSGSSLLSAEKWTQVLRETMPPGASGALCGTLLLVVLLVFLAASLRGFRQARQHGATWPGSHLASLGLAAILLILSQVVVYSGSGFYLSGRYYLPLACGIALLFGVTFTLLSRRPVASLAVLVIAVVYCHPQATRMLQARTLLLERRSEFGGFLHAADRAVGDAAGNPDKRFIVMWDPRQTESLHAFHRFLTCHLRLLRSQLLFLPARVEPVDAGWTSAAENGRDYYGRTQWEDFKAPGQTGAVFVFRGCDDEFLADNGASYLSPDFVRLLLPGDWVVYLRTQ